MKYIYFGVLILVSLVTLFYISKTKNKIVEFIVFFSSGIIVMCLINLTSKFTGLYIPINYFNIGVCSVLGIGGDLLILVLNTFLL